MRRPDGSYGVEVRRAGVEPSGCVFGFPIWLATRVRWQLSPERAWDAEVYAPFSVGRWNRWRQLLHRERFASAGEASAAGERLVDQVRRGGFDLEPG